MRNATSAKLLAGIGIIAGLLSPSETRGVLCVDFEDLDLPYGTAQNGQDGAGGFDSGHVFFQNDYAVFPGFTAWAGVAYSSIDDTNTLSFVNDLSVISGSGYGGTGTYAVVYDDPFNDVDRVEFPVPVCPLGFYINNTTYAALTMRYGYFFAKAFGGASGNDPDWLTVTITGKDRAGTTLGITNFYLADFRFGDNDFDYIVEEWTWVDLTALGPGVTRLEFTMASSDAGGFGINTPTYFAMDNLKVIPLPTEQTVTFEDLSLPDGDARKGEDGHGGFRSGGAFFENDYTAYPTFTAWAGIAYSSIHETNTLSFINDLAVISGSGYGGTGTYAVVYDDPFNNVDAIQFSLPVKPRGFFVNNTTYAALTMRHGYFAAKQFGGASGNDPDWLTLTVTGKDRTGAIRGTKTVYLADYRFADNGLDYIVEDWTWVELSALGPDISRLEFSMNSSDVGGFGINTPTYFAMDDLVIVNTFSGGMDATHPLDAAIPGFVSTNGIGQPEILDTVSNPAFAAWATTVVDYAPIAGLSPEWTMPSNALGPATGNHGDVVSLGELSQAQINSATPPGSLTLGFDVLIRDGAGPDFAVFENVLRAGGDQLFMELGYVDVSSDGTNFARFSSRSLQSTNVAAYETQRAEDAFGLAGKHLNGNGHSWGTPFDLGDLTCDPAVRNGTVDLGAIRFIRISDIPGTGHYGDGDTLPHPIYDPWETFGSGGIDIDAIGILNAVSNYHVWTSVSGPGLITPFGAPRGAVAVAHGDSRVFDIVALPGYHIAEVTVDGVSLGATNQVTLSALSSDHNLSARFGSLFTVYSPHGPTQPSVGTHVLYGPITASVLGSPMVSGTTQFVCRGWTGQGFAPTQGVATSTGEFLVTNDASISWHWSTNVWLEIRIDGQGTVDTPGGWYEQFLPQLIAAAPDPYFDWSGWSGNVAGDTNLMTLTLPLNEPTVVTAHFSTDVTSQGVPTRWLTGYRQTNGTPEQASLQDLDLDGMLAWEEFFAGTDPNDRHSRLEIVDIQAVDGSNCVTWIGGTNGSRLPFGIHGCTSPTGTWSSLAYPIPRVSPVTNKWWIDDLGDRGFFSIQVPITP